jgi:hypothetical protein
MKNPHRTLRICFALAFLLIAGNAGAQSVTIGTVPGSQFCVGDPISVALTATGTWNQGNVFVLQLSDSSGSFSNGFQKIGSLIDALPGTFSINGNIPYVSASTHYRFRILGASPYFTSADNGGDIAIGNPPATFQFQNSFTGESVGVPITFKATGDLNEWPEAADQAFWDLGSGATPTTATTTAIELDKLLGYYGFLETATYATPGDKKVTLRIVRPGGCSAADTQTYAFHIYDCSTPSIPHDAVVIESGGSADSKKTYWVNPGATLHFGVGDTIFVESGATVFGSPTSGNCLMYMKPGSVLNSSYGDNVVIFGAGVSLSTNSSDFTLNCPTLDFDYTNAPHNPAFPTASVKNDLKPVSITLSPNPTSGMLHIQGLPTDNITVSVFNILGETAIQQKRPTASNFTLDLSSLVAGTYYIRFASPNSVVTKKIVRN